MSASDARHIAFSIGILLVLAFPFIHWTQEAIEGYREKKRRESGQDYKPTGLWPGEDGLSRAVWLLHSLLGCMKWLMLAIGALMMAAYFANGGHL